MRSYFVVALVLSSVMVYADWDTSVNVGMNATGGNTDSVLLGLGFNTNTEIDGWNHSISASTSYGESDGEIITDKNEIKLGTKRFVIDSGYISADTSFFRDDVAGIDYRLMIGPGIGYQFDIDKTVNDVNLGVVYELENSESIIGLRLYGKSVYVVTEDLRVWGSLEYIPNVIDWGDFRTDIELGVKVKAIEAHSIQAVVKDRFVSEPSDGKDSNDIELMVSWTYDF